MNNVLTRKYLIISVVVHVAVLLVITALIRSNSISKTFIVFGAHSKKPTHTFMKLGNRGYVPFVGGGHKKGKGGKRVGGGAGHVRGIKKESAGKITTKVPVKDTKPTVKKNGKLPVEGRWPAIVRKNASMLENQATVVEAAHGVSVVDKKAIFKKNKGKDKGGKKKKEGEDKKKNRSSELSMKKKKDAEAEVVAPVPVKPPEKEESIEKKDEKVVEKKEEPKTPDPEQAAADLDNQTAVNDDNPADIMDEDLGDDADLGDGEGEPLEFNLLGSSDEEMRVYQKSIQTEVTRLWRPPLGVPKGTTCRVLFMVNRIGEIDRCEFVSRSKILIYDLSILRVAKQFNFDKCLWGKRFTIDFCQ